jgi:endonuclease/exonuclease/phosphatase family metal-dependent hydrolase
MKAKKNLSFIDRLLLWFNYLFCIAILISYLAPFTDPKKAWIIPFFGLAYPMLFVGNFIFIIYWLLRKKWYLILSVICIACGWSVLSNNIGFHAHGSDAAAVKDGKVIRMMTYNVHDFKRYGANKDISTKRDILQIIKDQKPDIIGFQEFYTRNKGEYDMRDSIISIMGTSYYYFEPVIANSDEAIGLAIFSKYPIVAHGIVPLTYKLTENACLYVDLKKGSQQFRVYSVHLQSIRFDPEDYKYLNSIARQSTAEKSSAWRVGSKLKNAFLKRSEQVFKIKENAAQCQTPYIISGDFNDTPSSFAVNEMARGLKNAFREKGFGFGRTYNGDFPNYQIDYIMTSPQFDVNNYQITEKKLSDHYPVRSDLTLK